MRGKHLPTTELVELYIQNFGSPLEKAIRRMFHMTIDSNTGVIAPQQFDDFSNNPQAFGDTRNKEIQFAKQDYWNRYNYFQTVYNGVNYRYINDELAPYMEPMSFLARQLYKQGQAIGINWDNNGGDYARNTSIYLDQIGVKNVNDLFVVNGRIIERSTGRDFGRYEENANFIYSAIGEGWTNIKMCKTAAGQLILYPSWGDSSDRKYAGAVVGVLLAWTGAGALIGEAIVGAGASTALTTAVGVTVGSTAANVAVGNQVTLKSIATTFVSSYVATSVADWLSGSAEFINSVGGAGTFTAEVAVGTLSAVTAAAVTGQDIKRAAVMGAFSAGMGHAVGDLIGNFNFDLPQAQINSLTQFISSVAVSRLLGERDWGTLITQGLTAAGNAYNQAARQIENHAAAVVNAAANERLLEVNSFEGSVQIIRFDDGSYLMIHKDYFDPRTENTGDYVVAFDTDGKIASSKFLGYEFNVDSNEDLGNEDDVDLPPEILSALQPKIATNTTPAVEADDQKYGNKLVSDILKGPQGAVMRSLIIGMDNNGGKWELTSDRQGIDIIFTNPDRSTVTYTVHRPVSGSNSEVPMEVVVMQPVAGEIQTSGVSFNSIGDVFSSADFATTYRETTNGFAKFLTDGSSVETDADGKTKISEMKMVAKIFNENDPRYRGKFFSSEMTVDDGLIVKNLKYDVATEGDRFILNFDFADSKNLNIKARIEITPKDNFSGSGTVILIKDGITFEPRSYGANQSLESLLQDVAKTIVLKV